MYQLIANAADTAANELGFPGVSMKLLSGDGEGGGLYVLTTMGPGSKIPAHSHTGANEFVYVLSGDFVEGGKSYGPGSFFFGLAGTTHGPHTSQAGCSVLTHYSAPLDFVSAT